MVPADPYKLDSTMKEIDKGWLVGILVFAVRVFVIFIVAFSRAVAIVATDKIPENLFDRPFHLPSDVLEHLMPSGLDNHTTPAVPPNSPSSSHFGPRSPQRAKRTYVIFAGKDVGHTASRQVNIIS